MTDEPSSKGLSRRGFFRRLGGQSSSETKEDSEETSGQEGGGRGGSDGAEDKERYLSPEEARRKLKSLGVSIMPLSEEDELLQVQCKRVGTQFGSEQIRLLEPLAPRIAWLNLARTSIEDDALDVVASMTELKRLYLQHTEITGTGLACLVGLEALEYLNLFGTHVGDEALDHLVELEGLQTVYLMQTDVSQEGVQSLRERRPDLTVEFGDPLL